MAEVELAGEDELDALRRRLARIERELAAVRTRRWQQLVLAAEVHRSLLPSPVRHPKIHVDVRYIPFEEVGGDYCQVHFPYENTCYVTICDVTGHGVGPALLATRVSSEVRYGILYGRAPCDVVRALNSFICAHFARTELYLSFVAARIDLVARRITWCGAGHPCPLLIRRDGSLVEYLESQNMLVGVSEELLEHPVEHSIDLEPGDRLVFYTDGVTETLDAQQCQFGAAGLVEVACQAMSSGLFQMADHILDRLALYQHGPAADDKTLIVAEIC